jgi:uncharacterized protein (TIGR02678 family)
VIAEEIRDTELADYQRAARTLLVHPLVTDTHPDRNALGLVRRFAASLTADLDAVAGYRLELDARAARLVRRVDRLDDTQLVRRRDRKPFDRRRYAYLCLVLAALGRAGSQVALTELADALRRRAAEIDDLGFDPDTYRHRLAFVDVVRHLLQLGALREVETSTVEWVRDPEAGEALYDVDRDTVYLVFVPPRVIQHVRSVGALLTEPTAASRDTRRAETRQRLARLLLEHPVLDVDDLDETERTYLASQANSLTADLQRLTGGQVERRAEGLALIDATGGFTDRRFPSGGTPAQAALLLADAMAAAVLDEAVDDHPTATVPRAADRTASLIERLDAVRPTAPQEVEGLVAPAATTAPAAWDGHPEDGETAAHRDVSPDGGPTRTGPLFTDPWLLEQARRMTATHGRAFAAELRDDPHSLVASAVEVLAAFDLVRTVPGGLVARPVLARYRDVRVETRSSQPSLLDDAAEPEAPTPEAPTPEAPTPEAPTPEAPTPEADAPEPDDEARP